MKRIIILGITIALAAAVACQSDFDNRARLDKIVADTAYLDYRTAVFFSAAHVVQGLYDLQAIGEIIKTVEIEDICASPDLLWADIRGGMLYRDTHCTMQNAAIALREKFPDFWSLDQDDMSYIRKKYDELMGGQDREELIQLFKTRFNED